MCEYINGTIIQEDFTVEKYIFDEGNGLWYEPQGDYYIPCLAESVQSAFGDSSTCGTSRRSEKPCTRSF